MALFNFMEINELNGDLIKKVRNKSIDGFIYKNFIDKKLVAEVKESLGQISSEMWMNTPSGTIFPEPFAVITDEGELLDRYYHKLDQLAALEQRFPALKTLFEKLDKCISDAAEEFQVKIPNNKHKHRPVTAGTFRYLEPNGGGLYTHTGNYFQEQSMQFYEQVENEITLEDQLSYFVVLQNAEKGGELTLYDLFWHQAQKKDHPENNDFVFDIEGNKVMMDALKTESFRPEEGDILIFSGGRIWHRVEQIKGNIPRLTLGGFLNFSKDGKELFYWS